VGYVREYVPPGTSSLVQQLSSVPLVEAQSVSPGPPAAQLAGPAPSSGAATTAVGASRAPTGASSTEASELPGWKSPRRDVQADAASAREQAVAECPRDPVTVTAESQLQDGALDESVP
jgi:hypothetical protein